MVNTGVSYPRANKHGRGLCLITFFFFFEKKEKEIDRVENLQLERPGLGEYSDVPQTNSPNT